MTVLKCQGELACECDRCGRGVTDGRTEGVAAFVEHLLWLGWRLVKDGKTWRHVCPECRRNGHA